MNLTCRWLENGRPRIEYDVFPIKIWVNYSISMLVYQESIPMAGRHFFPGFVPRASEMLSGIHFHPGVCEKPTKMPQVEKIWPSKSH